MKTTDLNLAGKRALITGGGKGIGKAIALCFAEHGADIAVIGRHTASLQEVADAVRKIGRHAIAARADITKVSEVERASAEIFGEFSRIDILVNNAGMSIEKPLVELSIEEWDQIVNVNLRGTVLCTKAVLPSMIKCGNGVIINIASAAGLRGLPGSTAYSASKAGVVAFTQALGDEVRSSGIRVNTICPGPVDTPMLQKSNVRDYILKTGGDLSSPEDVARTALYLSSQLSSIMNSQVITLRGRNRW